MQKFLKIFIFVLFTLISFAPAWAVTPSWVNNLPLWQWYSIPNTALSSVEPTPSPLGMTGPSSKITAWTGATLKREGSVYLIGAAGGHADYAGNEVDAFQLNTESPRWVQLSPPSPNSAVINGSQFYLDLKPSATHTYYATQFINARNRMIVISSPGMGWPSLPSPPSGWPYAGYLGYSFSFNLSTNSWDIPEYIARYTDDGDFTAALVVKHPITEDIYYSRNGAGWWRWNQVSNTWVKLSGTSETNYAGAAIDPIRNRMLIVGDYSGTRAPRVRDLSGNSISVTFGGLGASALQVGAYAGVVYDEANDKFLVFYFVNSTSGIAVLRVDPVTWFVDAPSVTGTKPAARPNGILNAVQYVPELGGIVIANSYTENVQFMRTSAGGVTAPPPPVPSPSPTPLPPPATTSITSPSQRTTLTPGQTITATGSGTNLSWDIDLISDGLTSFQTGTGSNIAFTVPANANSSQVIRIILTGDGGSVTQDYNIVASTPIPIPSPTTGAPYPGSIAVTGITFNWNTHVRQAPGSDNWPVTWADDDNQYTSWGDGGGFGGDNSTGRVSLGIARVTSSASSYAGKNVWGGFNTENTATFDGKSYGIISVDRALYMWRSPGSDATNYSEARIYRSTNHGASWTPANWAFFQSDGVILPTFLQFGRDYQGARDGYVYIYANHLKSAASLDVQKPGEVTLIRVPKVNIMDRNSYEFFAGLDANGNPTWTTSLSSRRPVFTDSRGVGWNTSASFNSGLGRYFLITEHDSSSKGNIGIFDAPNPWGPWSTVLYTSAFGYPNITADTFFWNFSNKWLSADGKSFTLVFTGIGANDSWNTVQGNFVTTTTPLPTPVPPTSTPTPPPPAASTLITAPAQGTTFTPGQTVTPTGSGTNLSWDIDLISDGLPSFKTGTGSSTTFTVPTNANSSQIIRVILTGDGGSATQDHNIAASPTPPPSAPIPPPPPPSPTPPPAPTPIPTGSIVTSFTLTSPITQAGAPFTLGHPFRQGDIPAGLSVVANIPNFQATVKSRWPDGSAKFAILSGRVGLQANTPLRVDLSAGTSATMTPVTEQDLLNRGINMQVTFQGIGTVNLSNLISQTGSYDAGINQWRPGKVLDWIQGPEMSSWVYSSPIGSDPFLTVWFEVRLWDDGQTEILPWIENGYLAKSGVTEKNGVVTVAISGTPRFSMNLQVLHHTRTPLVSGTTLSYFMGTDPQITFKHDAAYFQATKLVPTYGAVTPASSKALSNLATTYTPFGQANYPGVIGTAGYDPSIGFLPQWDVLYLTSGGDPRALASIRVNAYSAGRYGIHYRDEKTNRPLKFSSYPNLVISGTNSGVSSSGASSANTYTPAGGGNSPPSWATSHAPSVGYMAYLLTGHFYFLEECQFAATLVYLKQTDTYREFTKGILETSAGANTTRGAAWGLRSYTQSMLATPDNDPLKPEFTNAIDENILYYHSGYVAKSNNPQGIVAPYSDYTSGDNIFMHSMWMEDFLTAAFGYILDAKAYDRSVATQVSQLFNWKAQSAVGRLGQPGVSTEYDFRDAAQYTMAVAPSDNANWSTGAGPWYANWGEIYRATLGTVAGTAPSNQLQGGNFPEASSYWGNFQPAIAYAVTHNVPGASAAYARMTGASNWSQLTTGWANTPEWSVVPSAVPPPPSGNITPPIAPSNLTLK